MAKAFEEAKIEATRRERTAALKKQSRAAEEQTRIMRRQEYEANKEKKRQRREENRQSGKGNFHGLYCLLVGWWLAMFLICMIAPVFFRGGRNLIKKVFGIW